MIGRFCVFILTVFAISPSYAVDPFLNWQSLHSENFQVHFAEQNKSQALRAINIAESVHKQLVAELGWTPAEKTHLIISDETDFANGFATVINFNRSVLFVSPPTGVGGLEDFEDWLALLITHEYVHVLHLDKAHGSPAGLRKIFGRFFLSFPNLFQPIWLIEGLATQYETDHASGTGRGQSALFASMMRMEVANGVKPLRQVNLPISTWPAGTTRYLYGVYFFEFLKQTQHEDQVQRLIDEYSGNLMPFAVNSTFNRVFGKNLSAMWGDFTLWLEQRFNQQIATIQQQGVISGERISHSAYRTNLVRATDDAVYYIENSGTTQATLIRQAGGERTVVTEITSGNFDINANGDAIIAQLDYCDEYAIYSDLYLYTQADGELKQLTECGRYTRVVWHPDGQHILALKHEAAKFQLELLDTEANQKKILIDFEDHTIVGWFDVSPNAEHLVVSLWRPGSRWNLYRYELSTGKREQLTSDDAIQAYPEYHADGTSIIYSADYSGIYNLYQYDFKTAQHTQLTRTLAGAYQASSNKNNVYYIGYTAQGNDVFHLTNSQAIANYIPVSTPASSPPHYPDVEVVQTDYAALANMRPRWWFPAFSVTEDETQFGLITSGNDALAIHNYIINPLYDFENKVFAGSLQYSYSNLFSVGVSRSNTLFKDSAGNLNRIRSEDVLQFIVAKPNTGILSSSTWLMALVWENNSDSKLFANAAPANDFSDNVLGLAWLYNNSRVYPLSISRNDGREIRLVAEDGNALNSDFNGQVYTAIWNEYIRLGGEHVLALQMLQGWGSGSTSDFLLGGEDSGIQYDILLQQTSTAVFGRRDYALRGYAEGLPQLRGQRAQLLSVEWRFPGQRIERGAMAPPVGIMQWSGGAFIETGAAYDTSSPDKYFSSAGLELTADLNLFYLAPFRARLGLAHGFDSTIGETRAYFSLGSSF